MTAIRTLTDIDCPPSEARYADDSAPPAGATIMVLAARLNSASNHYRTVMDRPNSPTCRRTAADGLARAADELASAIADAVASGKNSLH